MAKIPVIAIVGRTNVGKSTLFNQIVGRRQAIVKDFPGVTRDRNYAYVTRYETPFTLIDTGGLVGEEEAALTKAVVSQTQLAIEEADLILAILDGLSGPHPFDHEVVKFLRRSSKPIIWVVNKCEKPGTESAAAEFYALGLDEYFCVSAAHNSGIGQLLAAVKKQLNLTAPLELDSDTTNENFVEVVAGHSLRLAIIGKPNVGKSTFVNKILGVDRLITSNIAGTTRDSIDIEIKHKDESYTLVDTAGLRKKNKVDDRTVERYSNLRTLRSLASADVAIVLLDATEGIPSEQDAKIAGVAHDRGKPLLFVVNKWDAVEKDHKSVKAFKDAIYVSFKYARYAPILFISALSGKRCHTVLEKAKEIWETANFRIPTSDLNNILRQAFERRPPRVYRGEPIKFYFATQIQVVPPTIVLFLNHPKHLGISYERYLKNSLRRTYPFEGTDIKLILRKKTDKENRKAA